MYRLIRLALPMIGVIGFSAIYYTYHTKVINDLKKVIKAKDLNLSAYNDMVKELSVNLQLCEDRSKALNFSYRQMKDKPKLIIPRIKGQTNVKKNKNNSNNNYFYLPF